MPTIDFTSTPLTLTYTSQAGFPVGIMAPPFVLYLEAGATRAPYVYVVDSGNNRVEAFTYQGVFVFSFGSYGSGNGQFNNPYGIASNGTSLYVSDYGNNRIQVFDMMGNYLFQFGTGGSGLGQFDGPMGIAVDQNFIWIVDNGNNRFQVADLTGNVFYQLGTFGSGTNQFNGPTDCAVDSDFFYINDAGNNRWLRYAKNFSLGWTGAISLPMITVSGSFYGHWWQGAVTLPMWSVSGSLVSQGTLQGSVKLPMVSVSGIFSARGIFAGSARLPLISVSGSLTAAGKFTASISLPMLTGSGTFTARGVFAANVALPMLAVSVVLSTLLDGDFRAIAVSTERFAVTEYTNYAFNSMCEFNGRYYAASASGLVRLDGPDDMGQAIVPVVRFGTNDLHENGVKKFVDSYFIGEAPKGTAIKFIYNEDETTDPSDIYTATLPDNSGTRSAMRVPVPKGMKSKRFVTVEITNAKKVNNYRLIVEPVPGRVR